MMKNYTETEIDDMVAEHERRQRTRDEALLDGQDDAGHDVDQLLAEAQPRGRGPGPTYDEVMRMVRGLPGRA